MRIASLQPSITLILEALGRMDSVCAHTRYCLESLPTLAERNLTVLEDSWSFDRAATEGIPSNLDRLLAARPDLVLASVPYRLESLAAILKCGLPVLTLAPHSLTDIENDIRLIGSIAHADGEPVVSRMRDAISSTRSRTAHLAPSEKPVVYCEEWGKPLIHSQPWVAELVEAAGGHFLGRAGAQTSADAVAAGDPDVLLFAWCGAGDRVPLARIIEQRGWQALRAVRAGRVHCIPDQFLNTPAPALLHGLACIAASAHPGLHPPHPAMLTLPVTDRERFAQHV